MYGSYRITPSCIAKAPYELRRAIEQALQGLQGEAAEASPGALGA